MAAHWDPWLLRTDPQLDQADAYGDIVRITSAEYLGGPRSTTHLELRMGVRDLALPVNGTARYEVKFETSTNSGYTLCAEVEHDWLRGYSVTPGLACQNTDAFLDFAEDEVGLRMACPALALTGTCVYGVHSFQGKVTRNGSTLDQTSAGDPQSVYRIVNQSEPPLALFTWTPANPTTSDWIQSTPTGDRLAVVGWGMRDMPDAGIGDVFRDQLTVLDTVGFTEVPVFRLLDDIDEQGSLYHVEMTPDGQRVFAGGKGVHANVLGNGGTYWAIQMLK